MVRFPALIAVFMLGFVGTAWAESRVALVIGNSIYEKAPKLANPGNDSADIAASLTRLGFKVQLHSNLDFQRMNQALRDFARASRNSEMAVVYYAGHGIEVDKKNWLIPTDAQLASDAEIEFETVSLDLLSQAVSGATVLRLVMVDACRENPFARQMNRQNATRSIGRGLGRVEDPGPGTLVVFAAAEGQLAEDGTGRNSPFATALLAQIEKPGNEVGSLFRKVRDDVMARTANRQQPFQYGSLPGRDIFFTTPSARLSATAAPAPVPAPAAMNDRAIELAFWNDVKDTGDPALLKEYLDRFGAKAAFASIANRKIETLTAKQEKPAEIAALPVPKTAPRATQQGGDDDAVPSEVLVQRAMMLDRVKKYGEAARLLKIAVARGDSEAQARLAYFYNFGQGVAKNEKEALRLYELSAAQDNILGLHQLANHLTYAPAFERNYSRAVKLYRRALALGDTTAEYKIEDICRTYGERYCK